MFRKGKGTEIMQDNLLLAKLDAISSVRWLATQVGVAGFKAGMGHYFTDLLHRLMGGSINLARRRY